MIVQSIETSDKFRDSSGGRKLLGKFKECFRLMILNVSFDDLMGQFSRDWAYLRTIFRQTTCFRKSTHDLRFVSEYCAIQL